MGGTAAASAQNWPGSGIFTWLQSHVTHIGYTIVFMAPIVPLVSVVYLPTLSSWVDLTYNAPCSHCPSLRLSRLYSEYSRPSHRHVCGMH